MGKTKTWVLVADGARAKMLAVDMAARSLEVVQEHESEAARLKTSELVTDRPGRSLDAGAPGQRSAMEPRTDPHRHEQEKFLGQIADALLEAARQDHFGRLVLVAEPRALGVLRSKLSKDVADRVSVELGKDLVGFSVPQLEKHLAGELFWT